MKVLKAIAFNALMASVKTKIRYGPEQTTSEPISGVSIELRTSRMRIWREIYISMSMAEMTQPLLH